MPKLAKAVPQGAELKRTHQILILLKQNKNNVKHTFLTFLSSIATWYMAEISLKTIRKGMDYTLKVLNNLWKKEIKLVPSLIS